MGSFPETRNDPKRQRGDQSARVNKEKREKKEGNEGSSRAQHTIASLYSSALLQISSTLVISHTREQNTLLVRNARTPDKRVLKMQRRGRQRERQKSNWFN